ncbi:acyltransferase domain-containing protein [Kitasatospora sp. NPDC092948]|uniref:acyltransferase domain-containing protein n=1 Tax=Kitasatospora sp. NPDC092948 TaxID=3364088 RepID=UPI00382EDB96
MDTDTALRPPRPVALLLPGQGSQYPNMARGLYGQVPAFTEPFEEVLGLLGPLGEEALADWLAERPAVDIDHVSRAQPLIFAVNYALARMLTAWGLRPAAFVGHSAGEAVAAVLAGVMSLPDAARLLAERVELIADAPPGGMLAVAAAPEQLAPYLTAEVVVGAVNGPQQVLLAGPDPQLEQVAQRLRADGHTCMRAKAVSGFHSPSLADCCRRALPGFAGVRLAPPGIPVHSGRLGGELDPGNACDPVFWAMQPAEPVLFAPALDSLLRRRPYLLVEAGPGQGLTALARRHREVASGRSAVVPLLGTRAREPEADRLNVLRAVRALVEEGHPVLPLGLEQPVPAAAVG